MSLINPLHISAEEQSFFAQQGYLKINQVLSSDLVQQLRDAVDALCASSNKDNLASTMDSMGRQYIVGVDKIVSQSEPIFSVMLGSPMLLSLAATLCGSDFFPVQDFVVIKNLHDECVVNWHQDVVTNTPEKTFMVGFYLDAANDENGALRIIPQSHLNNKSICEHQKEAYECIEMQPGDVLIHSLKLAHSSGALSTFERRRVVYFEFMSADLARKEGIYSNDFIQLRISLIPLAMGCFEKVYSSFPVFNWQNAAHEQCAHSENTHNEIRNIYQSNFKVKAANYCFDHFFS
jgi:ectoine hydroxylase-related dioxygenase (phytanoyl-CoA dioxygenase family)